MPPTEPVTETGNRSLSEALAAKLASLPSGPGVYQFRNAKGKVIYVGKAKNLRARVRSYFRGTEKQSGKTRVLVTHIEDIEIILTSSEVEALILENNLIKELRPRYNVNLKDDKTYPYLVITNEPFPRVLLTREVRRDGSTRFGPYTEAGQLRAILDLIGSIFPVRSCRFSLTEENITAGKFTVCLDYHIQKCKGPCEGLQSEAEYLQMIDEIVRLLKGRTAALIRQLHERMLAAAEALRFEEAAELKLQLSGLQRYAERQKVVSEDALDRDVFAIAVDEDDACGAAFRIREGKLLGSRRFILRNTSGEEQAALLGRVLEKYYLESPEPLPDELFLQMALEREDEAALRALLERKRQEEGGRGKGPKLVVPQKGDKAHLVAMCRQNARHHLAEWLVQKRKRGEAAREHAGTAALQEVLRLPKRPDRIECFDNSHFQGTDYVSSMVCFVGGRPKKSDYRKFRLQSFEGSDDYAAMEEVLQRRYGGSLVDELPMPDLVVVDGGKGQVNAAYRTLQALGLQLPVIGLAKRLEEVFAPNTSDPWNLPKTSPALRLLQQLRDESHRFAVTYHRKLRTKRTLQTELTTIPGIGEKSAFALLERFGSAEGVAAARLEELEAAVGKSKAEAIYSYYRK